ncbi:MAG TPA: hypothetical protein VEF04_09490 [Blastocatellia bacterium]|nr:hypothetical protein [Blastocatellia bacterium]
MREIIGMRGLVKHTGWGASTLRQWRTKYGNFPSPIRIEPCPFGGTGTPVWSAVDIDRYVEWALDQRYQFQKRKRKSAASL